MYVKTWLRCDLHFAADKKLRTKRPGVYPLIIDDAIQEANSRRAAALTRASKSVLALLEQQRLNNALHVEVEEPSVSSSGYHGSEDVLASRMTSTLLDDLPDTTKSEF